MSKNYTIPPTTSARVNELPTITATELKNSTADVLDALASQGVVAVTRHDKPRAVLLSIEQYEALAHRDPAWLDDLKQEYLGMLDRMQSPEQKKAAMLLFEATPEELGAAALAAAKKNKIGIFRETKNQ